MVGHMRKYMETLISFPGALFLRCLAIFYLQPWESPLFKHSCLITEGEKHILSNLVPTLQTFLLIFRHFIFHVNIRMHTALWFTLFSRGTKMKLKKQENKNKHGFFLRYLQVKCSVLPFLSVPKCLFLYSIKIWTF